MCCQNGKYSCAGLFSIYDDDKFSQGYGQINEAFIALTKDDSLQSCKSAQDFRSPNVRADDVEYKLYFFGIRWQQNFTATQPIKIEFKYDGVFSNNINGYALLLTNNVVSL